MTDYPAQWSLWLAEGARLMALPPLRRADTAKRGAEDPKFVMGDWLLATVPVELVDRLAEELGYNPAQLQMYREVAEKIPPPQRVAASWSVHQELRDHPHKLRPGLTVRELRALLGRKRMEAPPDHRLTTDHKVSKVFTWIAEDEVWNKIHGIIEEAKAYRKKDRDHARAVRSETDRRKREAEKRVKDLLNADSPYRVVLNARLGLKDSAMDVYGIGEIAQTMIDEQRRALELQLGLLDNALRVEEAGDILKVLTELMVEASVRAAIVEGLDEVADAVDAAKAKAVPADVIESEVFDVPELEGGEPQDEGV